MPATAPSPSLTTLQTQAATARLQAWLDARRAPPVLAMAIHHEPEPQRALHCHTAGQLYCLHSGLMTIHTDSGLIVTPPRRVGWIPPGHAHHVAGASVLRGWTVFVQPAWSARLPAQPAWLQCSPLLEIAVERLAQATETCVHSAPYRRLGTVILDELCAASVHRPSLPLPHEPRLRRIAQHLILHPDDPADSVALAKWAGISMRSLSRHWNAEVGMSLAKYRQIAKVLRSLDALAQGRRIQQIAWEAGFSTTGAYIHAFKAHFGTTPSRYFHA